MIFLNSAILRPLMAFFVVIWTSLSVQSQELLTYSGQMKLGPFQGTADYTYRLINGDTVYDGKYSFLQNDPGNLLSGKDEFVSITGSFNSLIPTGFWQFQFGSFAAGQSAGYDDLHYQIEVSGTKHRATGTLQNGKPQGTWIHNVQAIENSTITNTLFESTIQFNNGIPRQNFRIENEEMTLVGRFLRDGLAHDVWELYGNRSPESMEQWFFIEGRLEKINLAEPGRQTTLQVFGKALSNPQMILMDERYMRILQLKLDLKEDSLVLESNMNILLSDNAKLYGRINRIFEEFGSNTFAAEFKVMVDYFPLSEREILQIEEVGLIAVQSDEILKDLVESPQLQLLELADHQVKLLLDEAREIREKKITPMMRLAKFNREGVLEYVPRNELITFLDLGENLETVLTTARVAGNKTDSIGKALSSRLTRQQRQEALAELEEELIRELNLLKDQVDTFEITGTGPPVFAIQEVGRKAEEELKNYSEIEDLPQKMKSARELISCYQNFRELNEVLYDIPSVQDSIKLEYTDQVWNPFTLTVMDEEIKKRVLTAYNEILIPYLLDKVDNDLSCSNSKELTSSILDLNTRMLELKTEDTSRLERKLKKEKDPVEIMQLLELQI